MSTPKVQQNADFSKAAICARIRHMAAKKEISQADLARRSGLSYRLVHKVMHENANLRDRTIAKLAKALDVDYEDLVGRDDRYPETRSCGMVIRESARAEQPKSVEDAIRVLADQFEVNMASLRKVILDHVVRSKEEQQ